MLTAKDAKNISQKAANNIVPDLLNQILEFVNDSAEKGHTRCNFIVAEKPMLIIEELVKGLKKLGYGANLNSHMYIMTIDIKW